MDDPVARDEWRGMGGHVQAVAGMTLTEARAGRRENRRKMKTATGEALRLRDELEAIYAVLIYKLAR